MSKFLIFSFSLMSVFQARTQWALSGTYDTYTALSKKGISSLPFMVSHAKIPSVEPFRPLKGPGYR